MLLLMIVLALFERSQSYSTGAPAEACNNIYPIGHANDTESQDLSSNPFHLDFSDLDHSYGGSVYFVPGQSYTLTLSGSGGEQFRGFLVQARSMADGSPVGVFTDNGDDQTLSSCSPPESAVTHPNRDLKSDVTLLWTAPPEGSDHLHLLCYKVFSPTFMSPYTICVYSYAVVTEFSIFWAPAMTDTILSCGAPLYQHQGRCVEVCPSEHFGNSTSGHCQPYANNYILSINATQYYVYLTSETPVNTTVFRMQLSINLDTELSNIITISMTFSQNILVQNLFEFVNGSDNEFDATDYVQSITANTGIVKASISLVEHANDNIYPIDIAMTITALVVFTNSQGTIEATSTTAMAVGSIVLAPGACDFNHCENGGTCMDTNSTHFTCMCPPNFTGLRCNDSVIIDVCQLLQPCINGTCDVIDSVTYMCSCDLGYTGYNCTEHICEQITCTHGTCTFIETDGNYTCTCDSGYTGITCDEVINDCYYSGCNENGNCTNVDNTSTPYCDCLPGWTGMLCETDLMCGPNPCENNATCNGNNDTLTCVCTPGWTGHHCETQLISECDETPCFNNATCFDSCLDNKECLTGSQQSYECLCVPGYTGDTCNNDDLAITFCSPDSCANSGTCIEEYGPDISCQCTNGFSGPTCTEEIIMSCSQPMINDNVLIALICAVTSIIMVIIIGSLITIVIVVRYQTKAKRARTTFTNSLNLSDSRVFPNTNTETGIYFDPIPSNECRRSLQPANESSLPLSSSPINLPLQSRLRQESGTSDSLQSRETLEQSATRTFTSDTMSQITAASDYEQPVFTIRQHWHNMSQQNSSQVNFASSQYETVC